jgi:hypothetical protein
LRVQVEHQLGEAYLGQPLGDRFDRGTLLGDEQDSLPVRRCGPDDVGDGLALPGSWRSLDHHVLPVEHRPGRVVLRRVGVEHQELVGRCYLIGPLWPVPCRRVAQRCHRRKVTCCGGHDIVLGEQFGGVQQVLHHRQLVEDEAPDHCPLLQFSRSVLRGQKALQNVERDAHLCVGVVRAVDGLREPIAQIADIEIDTVLPLQRDQQHRIYLEIALDGERVIVLGGGTRLDPHRLQQEWCAQSPDRRAAATGRWFYSHQSAGQPADLDALFLGREHYPFAYTPQASAGSRARVRIGDQCGESHGVSRDEPVQPGRRSVGQVEGRSGVLEIEQRVARSQVDERVGPLLGPAAHELQPGCGDHGRCSPLDVHRPASIARRPPPLVNF